MIFQIDDQKRMLDYGVSQNYGFQNSMQGYMMVMENAGISLNEVFRRHTLLPREATRYLVAFFGHQIISILQAVHLEGIIHGDIHPGNFTYFPWRDPQMSVRLIDFGAATIHGRKEPKQQHNQVNYSFASAERISSPYKERSIADDLVSLAYTFIYLMNASLPWMKYIGPTGQPTDIVSLIVCKAVFPSETLCSGLPSVFFDFLSYVLKLRGSASCQDIDYVSYIRAFCEFSDLQFRGK